MAAHRWLMTALVASGAAAALAAPMPSNTLYLDAAGRGASPQAALEAHRSRMLARGRALEQFRALLVRKRALSPRSVMPRFDTFVLRAPAGRSAPATRQTRYGNGTLTFAYQGWTAQEEQDLRNFLNQAYPVLVNLYGPPASTATLTLIKGGYQDGIEGGEFDPVAMTLLLEPLPVDFSTGDSTQYGLNLLHLALHAFHAPAIIGFDAWEEGMARAAAAVAMLQIRPDFELIYSTSYLLPLYDGLNYPALSTPAFFPGGGMPQMTLWRVGMAMSAWLKIYAEQPGVFRAFHAAYYAEYTANPAIARNLTSLKGMILAAAPTVEDAPFLEWYDRQYVLKPIAVVGPRVYVYSIPLQETVLLMIHYYSTSLSGDQVSETPLSGAATLEYLTFDRVPLYPEEGNQVTISATGEYPGIGFLSPSFYNIGDPPTQRLRITTSIGASRASVYYPYFARGDDANENEFFGAAIGADDGTLQITVPGYDLPTTSIVQGAFSQQLPTGDISFFARVRLDYRPSGQGPPVTLWRNVGPGFYMPLLVVGDETAVTLRYTFLSGTSLITFPIIPDQPDPAIFFGYLPGSPSLRLAWWDPEAQSYRYYPAAPAVAPGRGFWLNLATARTVEISGRVPAVDDPRAIELAPDWNLIGNSYYDASLNPWAMSVESGTASFPLSEAVRRGIVGPVWTYNAGGYYEIDASVAPWTGGWILNRTGGPLTLRQQGAARGGRAPLAVGRSLLGEGGWSLAIAARTVSSQDRAAFLGVASGARRGMDALDWMKPPALDTGGVRLGFINPEDREAGAAYATDVRQEIGAGGEQWEFEVSAGQAGEVTLTWPDLRAAPPRYQLTLEDLATGARQYLRTSALYSYRATGSPDTPDVRRFRITVSPRQGAPLAFLNVQVTPARGSGASVRVTLTAPADLILEVRSPTGKLVRQVFVPASRANEPVLIPWSGRGADGKLVPSGTYVIFLTARTAEGYVIRRGETIRVRN